MIFERFFGNRNKAVVLAYHRVENLKDDKHLLAVSPINFDAQMKFLAQNYNVISLDELAKMLINKKIVNKSVVITFDDGYEDNYLNAYKILKRYNLPATFFVTSGYVNSQKEFWWDYISDEESIKKIKTVALKERDKVIATSTIEAHEVCKTLTTEQIKEMSQDELIEIGSHSVSHHALTQMTDEELKRELVDSKVTLEKIIGKEVKSFSLPYGSKVDFNDEVIYVIKETGYKYNVLNTQAVVEKGTDVYRIPRLLVRDWNLDEFNNKLKSWL